MMLNTFVCLRKDLYMNFAFCPKCGEKLEPEDKFCINCGTRLSDFEENEVDGSFKQQKREGVANNIKRSVRGGLTPPPFSSLQKSYIDQDIQEDLRSQRAQELDYKENRNKKQRQHKCSHANNKERGDDSRQEAPKCSYY